MPETLPELVGERVRLRPGTRADIEAVHRVRCDPTVVRWWNAADLAETTESILNEEENTYFFVIDTDVGIAGGIQFFEEPDDQFHHAAVDIFLGAEFQGRGLGREAMDVLISYLVLARGHHRITIDPAATNERAVRCYAAAGFEVVGDLAEYQLMDDGTRLDGTLMEFIAPERMRASYRANQRAATRRTAHP